MTAIVIGMKVNTERKSEYKETDIKTAKKAVRLLNNEAENSHITYKKHGNITTLKSLVMKSP